MSYVRIWIHCVWGIKNRMPLITNNNKTKITKHVKDNARSNGVHIDFINGHKDHIHCLISLDKNQNISKVIQLIKGESSFWINKNDITRDKFEWSDEYFAVSVSESQLNKVREYIKNQHEHHRVKSWDEEYHEFIKKYGFDAMRG